MQQHPFSTFKLFCLFITGLFFLFSCRNNINYLDDEYLGTIKLNNHYHHTVDINKTADGKAIETSVRISVKPENSGITGTYRFNPNAVPSDSVVIEGKPQIKGDIYVDLQWGVYGNMSYAPKLFKKRYILKSE